MDDLSEQISVYPIRIVLLYSKYKNDFPPDSLGDPSGDETISS